MGLNNHFLSACQSVCQSKKNASSRLAKVFRTIVNATYTFWGTLCTSYKLRQFFLPLLSATSYYQLIGYTSFNLHVIVTALYRTETQHMVRGISIHSRSSAVVCCLRIPSVHFPHIYGSFLNYSISSCTQITSCQLVTY